MPVKMCKKLRNYKARTRKRKKYIRQIFYCKTCGKKITELANEIFDGDCGPCSVKGF